MAFVFRAERNINMSNNSRNEYNNYNNENQLNSNILSEVKSQENILKDLNLINNRYNIIDSPSPPFLIGEERIKSKKEENSPGPGTYNISKGYYNKHRQFSSRQENSKPEEYEIFDLPLLRMKEVINDNPGPGQYYPSEKDLFGGKFKNKNKIIANRNNNSSVNNIYLTENNQKKQENNFHYKSIDVEKDINNLVHIFSSKRRKKLDSKNLKINEKTVNKKNMNEFEKSENFSMKNIKSPLNIQTSENEKKNNNNRVLNNNNSKISGLTLDTERTSINTSKFSYSQIRNKSSKLLQNLKSQFKTNQDSTYLYNQIATEQSIKNNTLSPILLKYDKSRIYKNEQNHERLLLSREQNKNYFMNNMTEFDKLLNSEYFSHSPGPGYYDPIDSQNQKYFKQKNILNHFNRFRGKKVTSLVKIKNIKNSSPDPGQFTINNDITQNEIKNKNNVDKKIRDILFDVKKIAKLRLLREKEASIRNEKLKNLKENLSMKQNYENNSKEIFEEEPIEYRKMHSPKELLFNFGSNDKRFHDKKKTFQNLAQVNTI